MTEKIRRYLDWRQTAKRKVSTVCIFPGLCKCSFCLVVTSTCHISASLYFCLYCLWGIKWWWCRLWRWCAELPILASCNYCQNCPIWMQHDILLPFSIWVLFETTDFCFSLFNNPEIEALNPESRGQNPDGWQPYSSPRVASDRFHQDMSCCCVQILLNTLLYIIHCEP